MKPENKKQYEIKKNNDNELKKIDEKSVKFNFAIKPSNQTNPNFSNRKFGENQEKSNVNYENIFSENLLNNYNTKTENLIDLSDEKISNSKNENYLNSSEKYEDINKILYQINPINSINNNEGNYSNKIDLSNINEINEFNNAMDLNSQMNAGYNNGINILNLQNFNQMNNNGCQFNNNPLNSKINNFKNLNIDLINYPKSSGESEKNKFNHDVFKENLNSKPKKNENFDPFEDMF